jgi:hypothetical protein
MIAERYRRRWLGGTGAAAFLGASFALMAGATQPVDTANQSTRLRLEKVDQGIADVGPLQVSQRDLGADLRVPSGFGDVYRMRTGSNWGRPGQDSYARFDGGVVAVFPRSVYVPSGNGVKPAIPPGTVFYLGHVPGDTYNAYGRGWGTEGAVPGGSWADSSVDTRVHNSDPNAPRALPLPQESAGLMIDEEYRKFIVRALLLEAAKTAR